MHNITGIKMWHKALDLTVEVYKATTGFPKEEKYGLTSQIRRSSVSVSSNIAEGAGRNSNNQFNYFLGIANGSSYELQTQLILANRLGLLNDSTTETLLERIVELQKMNYGFRNTLKNQKIKTTKPDSPLYHKSNI